MSETKDIKIHAYLTPHPLDEDTFLEEEWISWLPGYLKEEAEDGLPSYYHENNIELFENIEELTHTLFRNAMERLWPLLSKYHFKSINIGIDYSNFRNSKSSLAGYDNKNSNPATGNYYFYVDQHLLSSYASYVTKKTDKLPNINLWEHELIHLIDHWELIRASSFAHSDNPLNNLQYYVLKYREEGIANLFDLLDGKIKGIKSIAEAKDKFQTNYTNVKKKLLTLEKSSSQDRESIYSGYDFYEVGPWIILDMLKEIPMVTDIISIEELEDNITNGIIIDDHLKLEIMKNAFYFDIDWFYSEY